MNHETGGFHESRTEKPEPIERFDNLLAQLINAGESGWVELPGKWVVDPVDNKSKPIHFWVFNPKPLSGYETAKYSPSIMLEVGEREFDDGAPVSKADQYSINRAYFEKNNPRYKAKDEMVLKSLEKLEIAVGLYAESTAIYEPKKETSQTNS
jgi:hypothetical protein